MTFCTMMPMLLKALRLNEINPFAKMDEFKDQRLVADRDVSLGQEERLGGGIGRKRAQIDPVRVDQQLRVDIPYEQARVTRLHLAHEPEITPVKGELRARLA
jgi:hypothetical protein